MFTSSTGQLLQCPSRALLMDGRWKSNVEIAPNCPRCASTNTKFCYYNNYSLSQPRYFCKGCRRYWTKGGSLRNVPVGGGCRKNRRGRSVRVAQGTDSVSVTNYSRKVTTSSSESDPPNDHSFGNNGSDIDLAAVFANFLNQNSNSDSGQELAKDENLVQSIEQEEMIIDCQQPTYVIEETESPFPHVQGEEKIHELNDNEFLPLLGHDQGVQEDLWCDDSSIGLQNFSWQPMVQLQEFDSSLSCDDQLKISMNPVIDNLSCFDMSGFEVFFKA